MSTERLVLDSGTRFSCSSCGRCCNAAWAILVPEAKKDEILARPWGELGRDPGTLLSPHGNGLWALTKKPGTTSCTLLGDDGLCELHRHWGAEAKPQMCRRFPHLAVSSDEQVWVTANYGCKAVQEGHGPSLHEDREALASKFSRELESIREDADIGYPIGPGQDLGGPELDQLIETLSTALGDQIFPALTTLAAFTSDPSTVSQQPALPRPTGLQAIPGEVRYAFALSLYSDAVDTRSFWGRLQGVFALPRMLSFRHVYTSRLLGEPIDMGAILAHPGHLPADSEALLLTWIRSRLRSRLVLKDVPHMAAGVTRLLLQADAVLFFARGLARDRPIAHDDVLRGLEIVELYIANQQVVTTLAQLDPKLPRFWQDPGVAHGAAALFVSEAQT